MSAAREPYVGRRVKRTEDPRLIRGLAHYVDDLRFADLLHVSIVRSMYAHARIVSLDLAAARSAAGVVDVVTVEDLDRARIGDVPCAASMAGMKTPAHRPLARGKVRFVGEPVAAIVATSAYAARDAVDLVSFEFDPLDAAVDLEKALAPGSPLVHEELGTNKAFEWSVASGDLDAVFKSAAKVLTQRIVHQRLIPCPMEPRGCVAQYLPGERQLTLWTSTQIPHLVRTALAAVLGLAENRVRVVAPEVGGGFGAKLNFYAEEILLSVLAMRLGPRPVKWIATRREDFAATIHGRGQLGMIEGAADAEGRLLGIRYRSIQDLGAYPQLLAPAIPTLTGLMLPGCYKVGAMRMDLTGVYTNKMSTDAYRGAGRPEATYQIERLIDLVADELKLDPVEVRRRNFPAASEFPFKTASGLTYDSGDYRRAMDKALALAGYEKLRAEQQSARLEGRLLGVGVSSYVEICALGPSAALAAGGWESATVRIEPSGKVTVLTGASPHGQGQETSFAQLAADFLGTDLDDVIVKHGDTAEVQYGIGTFGSRATAVGGTALWHALGRVVEKAKRLAAHLLGAASAEAVGFEGGVFVANGKTLTLAELATAAHHAKSLPEGFEPGLQATYAFEPKNFTFPFGTHVCVVEVDRNTGDVRIVRYVAVDDCGRVLNPLLVDGQVHGGIVQALGQALFEEAVYDEGGQLVTGTFMDYALPRAHDCPRFETDRTETPTDVNPLGVKGVGEAGTIGATPAIVNAVVDALEPFGVRHVDMPLRPEKIWRLIQAGGKA
ncbi:MAG: xanthine dehydrogenase family protein molybdopterin-binding subunit [Planctomycetes bacterium]|nr:xanthine dehydrogenase family protein molybdopterin-binding subunit [Planctomycetota bacterium]